MVSIESAPTNTISKPSRSRPVLGFAPGVLGSRGLAVLAEVELLDEVAGGQVVNQKEMAQRHVPP